MPDLPDDGVGPADLGDLDPMDLFVDPSPDEDAWEAWLLLALERMAVPQREGLSNRALADVEEAIGSVLPFEVGLLYVMGIPDDDRWRPWTAPAEEAARWEQDLAESLAFDVEHNGLWLIPWGERPEALEDRLAEAERLRTATPSLFPLYGHRAIPLAVADGETSNDGNPVLSVSGSDVISYGDDLAAWMHREFDVPLPMWETSMRRFPFWSDLIDHNAER